ncbi:hypothetical protein F2Q68_00025489 [Brassica cretica]|uniref:Uncharacterized protein n=1 Tax=Brassica cretica TaxID=69181 RepID=A0A8S9IDA1_BRACR|nr:hypothetical protein F2Q68_00025489 [Brassica cretica]
MRKWFISCLLKSLQSSSPTHDKLSRKQKDLSTTTENNKFMVWMENNKFHHEVEDNDNPDCCSKWGCYKVGKVWKDLRMLMTSEISESYSAPAQASQEPMLIENQSDDIVSTPSSKRKEDNKEAPELHSTSKKQCTKAIKSEKTRNDNSGSS